MSAYAPPKTHNGELNPKFNPSDYSDNDADAYLKLSGGNISGNLNVTGELTIAGTQIVSFVSGMIMLWSGSSGSIPTGWLLCDGTNNTPDLRNRFVVGAGYTYSVNDTGGSADAIIPSHSHSGSTSSAGAHSHTLRIRQSRDPGGADLTSQSYEYNGLIENAYTNTTTFSAGAHSHSLNINPTGESVENKNLPPFYALCYIIKN